MGKSGAESPQSGYRLDTSDGELLVHTDVAGRAARMGHRLTIAMTDWQAAVTLDGAEPTAVELTVEVDSLQVLRGEGGLTPLSGPEKAVVRSNALGCFDARRYPQIRFHTETVEKSADGYRLTGAVEIHGVTRQHTVDVEVAGNRVSCVTVVRHRDFGMKPYSMMLGSLKVVDEVRVTFTAQVPTASR